MLFLGGVFNKLIINNGFIFNYKINYKVSTFNFCNQKVLNICYYLLMLLMIGYFVYFKTIIELL